MAAVPGGPMPAQALTEAEFDMVGLKVRAVGRRRSVEVSPGRQSTTDLEIFSAKI